MGFRIVFPMIIWIVASLIWQMDSDPIPGCSSKCGELYVPYPFGFGDEHCSMKGFHLTCETEYNPPRLYLGTYQVLEIRLLQGQLLTTIFIARVCFDTSGNALNSNTSTTSLRHSPFTFSAQHDSLFAVGCDTFVFISDKERHFTTGCTTYCTDPASIEDGWCCGIGCCAMQIPKNLKYFRTEIGNFMKHTSVSYFNPCSFAFVADKDFVFNKSFLGENHTDNNVVMPVVLEFSMENSTCETIEKHASSACVSSNSKCFNSANGMGYICNCSQGYTGNPYLRDGCRDIDECQNPKTYPCNGICTNLPGDYKCTCQPGYHSSNAKTGECTLDTLPAEVKDSLSSPVKWTIGSIFGGVVLALVIFGIYWGYKTIAMLRLRQIFFQKNGGIILRRRLASHRSIAFNIFTAKQLEKATDNFSDENFLGRGGYGTVHKGQLKDKRLVAVKKAKIMELGDHSAKQREAFAKELLTVASINHNNVVKIFGCCLEVKVPLLVYEYIKNNSLDKYIHGNSWIDFSECLQIATDVAKALTYLHDEVVPTIIHGDVKTSNILLDENNKAKIADFGFAKFVEDDNVGVQSMTVRGTPFYLDPEYQMKHILTNKCDVYSFGIVLIECVTRRDFKKYPRLREEFESKYKENKLEEMLNPYLRDGRLTEQMKQVSALAITCVEFQSCDRPTMSEVLMTLQTIGRSIVRTTSVEKGGPSTISVDYSVSSVDLET